MLPLRDYLPRLHRPVALWSIIAVNILFFLYELELNQVELSQLFYRLGVVPARYFHPQWSQWMGLGDAGVLPFFTHMFLHSGWVHFLVNMWILWVFADNVEDVMGPWRFVVFYLLCGLGALGTHLFFYTDSTAPVIGASGAIAGVMGAYLLLYPHARVLTLIPIFFFPYLLDLPALIFLGVWLLIQVLSGLFTAAGQGTGVAWWAHAGGFAMGMILIPFFRIPDRCNYCYRQAQKRGNNEDDFYLE